MPILYPRLPKATYRALVLVVTILLVGLALGCSQPSASLDRSSTRSALGETLSLANLTFRLRHPPGEHLHTTTHDIQEVELAYCDPETPTPPPPALPTPTDLDLTLQEEALALLPYQGLIAAVIRENYETAGHLPPEIQATPLITIPAGTKQRCQLGWQETWDENTLEAVANGQIVAEIPVRVLLKAQAYATSGETIACDGYTPEAVAPTLPTSTPPPPMESTLEPTLQMTPSPCSWPEARTSAEELVARYLRHLGNKEYEAAYALLSETYRLRLPYPRYMAGYAPVHALALCALETRPATSSGEQVVHATLQLTLEMDGKIFQDTWRAQYHVIGANGSSGGAIDNVSMYKAFLAQEE